MYAFVFIAALGLVPLAAATVALVIMFRHGLHEPDKAPAEIRYDDCATRPMPRS